MLASCSKSITYTIPTCDEPETITSSQCELSKKLKTFSDAIETANASNNSIQLKTAEQAAQYFKDNAILSVKDWIAAVTSVETIDDTTLINAKADTHIYTLMVISDAAKDAAATLSKDDLIVFDGEIGKERSFSLAGALRNPEFRFYPHRITVQKTGTTYTQTSEEIASAEAKEREALELSKAKDMMRSACKQVIKNKFDNAADISFGIMDDEFIHIADKQFAYSNTVTVTNIFGTKIKHGAVCAVQYRYHDTGGEMQVKVDSLLVKPIK